MLHSNLKLLRKRKRLSQEDLARELDLTRSTLSAYENHMAEPSVSTLLRIANYFKISLDRLLRQDLSKLMESDLREIELGLDHDVMGKRLRILTTTVNDRNEENIQVITAKARAGYTSGYADPEYISELPKLHLPMLSGGKTYRAFPIIGDSMPPVAEGSFVVGSYMEDWKQLRDARPYIVVTQSDGIVFKVLFNWLEDRGTLQFCSTNPDYPPYEVAVQEVLEIWAFENYICPTLPTPDLDKETLSKHLLKLQREVDALKRRMVE